jgi:hypothetical protein
MFQQKDVAAGGTGKASSYITEKKLRLYWKNNF